MGTKLKENEYSVKNSTFKRGIYKKDISLLTKNKFWKAILDAISKDKDLISCVREDEIHVYYKGCKVCGVIWSNGKIWFETHRKYLAFEHSNMNKNSRNYVQYDEELFIKNSNEKLGNSNNYTEFLSNIKSLADPYVKGEKEDIHKIIKNNSNVLDLEVSFGGIENISDTEATKKIHKRIDFVFVKEISKEEIELQFFESKLYSNSELRCKEQNKNAPIISQLNLYDKLIGELQKKLVGSYKKVIEDQCDIGIEKWEKYRGRNISINPKTKLIITSIGDDLAIASKMAWDNHFAKIVKERGKDNIMELIGENFKFDLK